MTKNEEYFQNMLRLNKEQFANFTAIHQAYTLDPRSNQEKFNEVGRDILDIIRDWEDKLCNHSESGKYAKFSAQLSDKFWGLIREKFPKIDYVGVK